MDNQGNLNSESFDENFRTYLEWHLTATFKSSKLPQIKSLTCDGILPPFDDRELSKKNVNDTRKIETEAWIGIDGQDKYKMIINLGNYSQRRYAKGSSLKDCVPDNGSTNWLIIDVEKRTIELQLN